MLSQQEKDAVLQIHTDHLGTPRAVSNGNTVLWRWEGEAFGDSVPNEQVAGPSRKFTLPLRFPGQYYDSETGLNYNYFRDYDSATGRYVESDPIGLRGGINTYAYVEGNPILYKDPKGLDWIYSQSTGALSHSDPTTGAGTSEGTGYAGNGDGLNNPAAQEQSNTGPIPTGLWTIEPQQDNVTGSGTSLPGSMRLTPDPETDTAGRGGFLIHGDNSAGNNSASHGCIILRRSIRDRIGSSGDNRLNVVP